jgi:hypothetical protein
MFNLMKLTALAGDFSDCYPHRFEKDFTELLSPPDTGTVTRAPTMDIVTELEFASGAATPRFGPADSQIMKRMALLDPREAQRL